MLLLMDRSPQKRNIICTSLQLSYGRGLPIQRFLTRAGRVKPMGPQGCLLPQGCSLYLMTTCMRSKPNPLQHHADCA
eukprot:scaffold257664_cov53-Prasinocladus_malaysianus.AAC.1